MSRKALFRTVAILLLTGAALATGFVDDDVFSIPKVVGAALAFLSFLPVFYLLRSALRKGDANVVLGTFVGGFFFKLVLLLFGVWAGVKLARWPINGIMVSILSFIFAFQVIEALYFWSRQSSS